jgi:hypothetical protein
LRTHRTYQTLRHPIIICSYRSVTICATNTEDFDELKFDLTAFFESQPVSFFKRAIELLPARWAKVVENNGDYIVD